MPLFMQLNTKQLITLLLIITGWSVAFGEWSNDPFDPIVIYDAADFGGSPRKVQICGSEDGGCFIVWEDPYYSLNQIRAQKISIEGDLLWDDEGVIVRPNRGNNDIPPDNSDALANISDVLSDGEGGVYVLWRDYANSDLVMEMRGWVNNEIYAQHIDADGELLWQDDELGLLICSFIPEEENQRFAGNLLSDGDGGCFFTWFDEHNPNDDSRNSIYLQRLSPDGELLLGENGTCIGQNDFTSGGRLYSDQQGGFFIDEYQHIFHVSNEGEFWDDPLPDTLNGWR
ncbi:hypothetical protein HQ587_07535, partial [bacterium]|nr:hypothetical protein [bacterium]